MDNFYYISTRKCFIRFWPFNFYEFFSLNRLSIGDYFHIIYA